MNPHRNMNPQKNMDPLKIRMLPKHRLKRSLSDIRMDCITYRNRHAAKVCVL